MMNHDELLIQANILYPKGTKYIDGYNGVSVVKVEGKLRIVDTSWGVGITDGCGGYVYYNSKWSDYSMEHELDQLREFLYKEDI